MVFENLIRRLHRVFDKEHDAIPVIALDGSGYEVTASAVGVLIKSAFVSRVVPITDDTTLQALADAINSTGLVIATLNNPDYAGHAAKGLLSDTAIVNPAGALLYPTSLLWREMMVAGWVLDEQADRILDAESQLYLHSAGEDWLECWLAYLAGTRKDYEDDAAFRTRVVNDILTLNQNNIALGDLIRKAITGLDCAVTDMPLVQDGQLLFAGNEKYSGNQFFTGALASQFGRFQVQVQIDMGGQSPLDVETTKILDIVERHKSAGTKMDSIAFLMQTTDAITASDPSALTVHVPNDEILPWGYRYDGSLSYDNGQVNDYDGSRSYNGATSWIGFAPNGAAFDNEWDSTATAMHLAESDAPAIIATYNGSLLHDAIVNYGGGNPALIDAGMLIVATRRCRYNGINAYGNGKTYSGAQKYTGGWDHSPTLLYSGDYITQEIMA